MRALALATFLLLSTTAYAAVDTSQTPDHLKYEIFIRVTKGDGGIAVLKWTPGGHPHFFDTKQECMDATSGKGDNGAAFMKSFAGLQPQIAAMAATDPKLTFDVGCVSSDPDNSI